jgi:hypothetical protein
VKLLAIEREQRMWENGRANAVRSIREAYFEAFRNG